MSISNFSETINVVLHADGRIVSRRITQVELLALLNAGSITIDDVSSKIKETSWILDGNKVAFHVYLTQ